jgi:TolB protein
MAIIGIMVAIAANARAADLVVGKAGADKDGISLAGLTAGGAQGRLFLQTLQGDLERSGWFKVVPTGAIRVTGAATDSAAGVAVACQVTAAGRSGFKWARSSSKPAAVDVRREAHLLADEIVKQLKGVRGMASSRIVFVNRRGSDQADLYACDADGQSVVQVTHDNVACVGPKWDRDNRNVYYTSYLRGHPTVFRVPVDGGVRQPLADFTGLNTGAEVSPDRTRVAIVLSVHGNPEIYTITLAGGSVTRLTQTPHAAEASPAWSPDGSQIVYVSDASGKPNLYVVDVATRRSRRLTYRGSENVNPDWGSDGRICYASRRAGYQIAVMDPAVGESAETLTSGPDYEDPAWAPDARHIVCSRSEGNGRSTLCVLDTMGDPPVRLLSISGNWMSPDWSDR